MKQFQLRGDLCWQPALFVVFQPPTLIDPVTMDPVAPGPPVFRVIRDPEGPEIKNSGYRFSVGDFGILPDLYFELPANWYVLLV